MNDTITQNDRQKADNIGFGTQNVTKLILKFGIPCAVSLVVNALYNIVDQIFIGQSVGYLGNAATNVSFGLVILALSFALLIGDGAAAYYSLMIGAGHKDKASNGVGNSLTLLTVLSILFMIVGFIFTTPLLNLFGATPEVMPYAMDYTKIILLGFPAVIISTGINSLIRADGSPNFAMITMLLGAVMNLILDPILIFKFGMGVRGAAIATIIGQYASLILAVYYTTRFKNISFKTSSLKLNKFSSLKIMSLGLSSFFTEISFVVVIAVVNQLLVFYGSKSVYGSEIPLAALGIVMKVNQILMAILLGIALGSQPIAGYNYGAKKYSRVKETFGIAVKLSTVCAAVAFIVFMFFPQYIILIFGNESPLYMEFAIKCFRLHLPFCIVTGFYVTSTILFQAIGKPVKSTILSLARQIILVVPLSIGLAVIWGVDGVLLGGAAADFLSFILSAIMVAAQMKQLDKMQKEMDANTLNKDNILTEA